MRLTHRHTLHTRTARPAPDPPLVELVDLTLAPHLHHLDLAIHPGQHIALVGLAEPHLLSALLSGQARPTHGHLRTPRPTRLHLLEPAAVLISTKRHRALIRAMHHPERTKNADRILYLEHGHLTETGTHSQLLLRGGSYARAYALAGPHRNAT